MTGRPIRYCRCGTRLARDNRGELCGACQQQARASVAEAPEVPPEFWQTDQLRDAFAAWHMGRVIQAYRTHPWHGRPLSQSIVAGWAGMTQTQLSRMENGPAPQDLAKLIQWAHILRIPHSLLWFKLPDRGHSDPGPVPVVSAAVVDPDGRLTAVSETTVVRVHVDGREVAMPLDRRTLLRDGLAAALSAASTAALPGGLGSVHRQSLTSGQVDELVAHLREQWHLLVKTDNLLGPRYAIASVHHQLAALGDLLAATRGGARREVVRLASQYAESAAWLHEDADELLQAQRLTRQAMEWAHEAGDHAMLAWTLFRRSQQAVGGGDGAQAIGLAQAAQRDDSVLAAPMRAALTQQEAHGHALDGDEVTTHRLLDRALEWATTDTAGDARGGHGSFCTATYLDLQRAHCWLRLRRPERAIQIYEMALPTLPSVYRRDRGVALSHFAAAYVEVNEPVQAATVAREALDIAWSSGSVRTEQAVASVGRHLAPHAHLEPVAALLDDLRAGALV